MNSNTAKKTGPRGEGLDSVSAELSKGVLFSKGICTNLACLAILTPEDRESPANFKPGLEDYTTCKACRMKANLGDAWDVVQDKDAHEEWEDVGADTTFKKSTKTIKHLPPPRERKDNKRDAANDKSAAAKDGFVLI